MNTLSVAQDTPAPQQSLLYPCNSEPVKTEPNETASTRFVLVPVDLIKRKDLSDAELRQLILMMSYSRVDQHEIWAEQETFAEDRGCSLRTVNRNVAALETLGLAPVTRRLRCTKGKAKGEFRQNVHTLAPVWGMLPAKVVKKLVDHETKMASDAKPKHSQNPSTTRQICRNSKYNKGYVNEIQQPTKQESNQGTVSTHDVVVNEMNNEDTETVHLLLTEKLEPASLAKQFVQKLGSKKVRFILEQYRIKKASGLVRGAGWLRTALQNPERDYSALGDGKTTAPKSSYFKSDDPYANPEPAKHIKIPEHPKPALPTGTGQDAARALLAQKRGGISLHGWTNTQGYKR